MIKRLMKTTLVLVMLASVSVLTSGCLVSGSSRTTISGKKVPGSIFRQIKVGETTKEELFALLGPASSSSISESGMEVLHYSYNKTKTGSSNLFLIWSHSDNSTEKENATFVFKNNILQSYARE